LLPPSVLEDWRSMTTFSCTTPPRLSIVYSSICIRISIVQDLSGFAACYGGRCVVCVQVGSILFLLTTWHSRPSSSGKLLKTARRKQVNCRRCLFLAIRLPPIPTQTREKNQSRKREETEENQEIGQSLAPCTFNSHQLAMIS
jgi:hypothetical protein